MDIDSSLSILPLKLVKKLNVKLNSIEPLFIGRAKGKLKISNVSYNFMKIGVLRIQWNFM